MATKKCRIYAAFGVSQTPNNGIGCKEIVDGMGISGMRKRMRQMKGILDFETEAGFTINMLLPL